jgi:hypothetical protein
MESKVFATDCALLKFMFYGIIPESGASGEVISP